MKTIFDHIETVKAQPHHVRKGVAYAVATGGAALVGLIWVGVSLANGAYAIQGANFAEATGYEASATGASLAPTAQVAGAAAALGATSAAPAHIEIIDAATSTPAAPEPTVIPF